jgi:hypothetical protein
LRKASKMPKRGHKRKYLVARNHNTSTKNDGKPPARRTERERRF